MPLVPAVPCRVKESRTEESRNPGKPRDRTLRSQRALFHNLAGCCLDAITDGFLVYIQSDIVDSIHGVLLIEISGSLA